LIMTKFFSAVPARRSGWGSTAAPVTLPVYAEDTILGEVWQGTSESQTNIGVTPNRIRLIRHDLRKSDATDFTVCQWKPRFSPDFTTDPRIRIWWFNSTIESTALSARLALALQSIGRGEDMAAQVFSYVWNTYKNQGHLRQGGGLVSDVAPWVKSVSCPITGAYGDEKLLFLKIIRDPAHADDTMTGSVSTYGAEIKYKIDWSGWQTNWGV